MRKPSFKVVTNVVILLTILGVLTKNLQPYIRRQPRNALANEKEAFLRQAAFQSIQWKRNSSSAFSQARHEGKPILFLIGAPWSTLARRVDQRVFRDPDVARFLNRNYICIRVDASEDRKWLSAFLPYSRMTHGLAPGFQAWILDPQARLIDLIGRTSATDEFGPVSFINALIDGLDTVDRIRNGGTRTLRAGQAQISDLQFLRSAEHRGAPDFQAFGSRLEEAIDPTYGGFPRNGFQTLQPNAVRYLLLTDRRGSMKRAVDPLVYSGFFDLVDGGFFRFGSDRGVRTVTFDKVSTFNAEASASLAIAASLLEDDAYGIFARSAFDFVTNRMVENGLVATCKEGWETPDHRSPRHNFGLSRLRRWLQRDDVAWSVEHLNLDPARNRQMIPFFSDRDALIAGWRRGRRLGRKIGNLTPEPPPITIDSAEAHCLSSARLLEAARLWDDPNRTVKALALARSGERFRDGSIIYANSTADVGSDYLGDWLAYSDLALQRFLQSGDPQILRQGANVLEEALRRFRGFLPGEFYAGTYHRGNLEPQDSAAPEIADNLHESCTARLIRLCADYSKLLAGTALGSSFGQHARDATNLYSASLGTAGPAASGYYCAALTAQTREWVLTVGPSAVADANRLVRAAPLKLVAPAAGPVGAALQGRSKGVYFIGQGAVEGPMSPSEAAIRLAKLPSRAADAP